MRFLLLTKDPELKEAFLSPEAFMPSDKLAVYEDWNELLAQSQGADLVFIDILATLERDHEIQGYEDFANAKMDHEDAKDIPLVLVEQPAGYDFDFMVGWPDFVFARLKRPVLPKIFRRASTWI